LRLSSTIYNHADDAAFNAAIYELSHGPLNFDLDRLECLVFNPIEISALTIDCLTMSNVDPGLNVQALLPPTIVGIWLKIILAI
jgi:hypothetical protein